MKASLRPTYRAIHSKKYARLVDLETRMMAVRCIRLAIKNIAGPTIFNMKNSGQGFVVLMTKADSASQMATEFHTMTSVQTASPFLFSIRKAITIAETPITASPSSGISQASGRPANTNVNTADIFNSIGSLCITSSLIQVQCLAKISKNKTSSSFS